MTEIKPGDICTIENCELYPHLNGAECTILDYADFGHGMRYKLDLRNPKTGRHYGARRHQLRLKGKPTPEEREYTTLIDRLRKPLREVV